MRNKILSFVYLCVFCALIFCSCESAYTTRIRPIPRDEMIYYSNLNNNKTDNNDKISTTSTPVLEIKKVGDEWSISLNENPSTGYLWNLETIGSERAEITDYYTAAVNDAEIVGAPGIRTWTIKAISTGMLELHFTYSRPWEKDNIAEKIDFYYSISN